MQRIGRNALLLKWKRKNWEKCPASWMRREREAGHGKGRGYTAVLIGGRRWWEKNILLKMAMRREWRSKGRYLIGQPSKEDAIFCFWRAKQRKDREDGHERMRVYLLGTGSTKTLLAREIESRQGLTAVGKQQGGLTKGHDE
jgi:hypothetical protein